MMEPACSKHFQQPPSYEIFAMGTKIDIAQDELHDQLTASNVQRKELYAKVRAIVDQVTITPQDSPGMIESKLAIFTTADSLLKSADAAQISKVKILLARSESSAVDALAGQITEILKRVNVTRDNNGVSVKIDTVAADKALLERATAECAPPTAGELEVRTVAESNPPRKEEKSKDE